MAVLFKYVDVDGDRLAVFDAEIPGKGLGVNIKTDHNGCSIPKDEIPALIEALEDYLRGDEPPFDENHHRYHAPARPLDGCANCRYMGWLR